MPKRSLVATVALAVFLNGCGGDSTGPNERANLNGQWTGVVTIGESSATMSLTLTHNRDTNAIQGAGTFGSFAVSASGTFARPTVTLTLTSTGYEDMNFTGTHDDGVITGRLNGSGFLNDPLVLRKN